MSNGDGLETKRILIFVGFAYGIAWLFGLAVYLTGGLANSPGVIPGTGITLSLILIAGGYMWAPAVSHALTRLITNQGWENLYLKPRVEETWKYWGLAWFLPAVLTLLGAGLFFVLFPQYFDPSLGVARDILEQMEQQTGEPVPLTPEVLVALQFVQALLIAPLINGIFTFGEEFGWRGYLQPMLMPLGKRKAVLLVGVIWGVWHWPVIAMGHNYGLNYPGSPWSGMLAMVLFTTSVAVFLGWVTVQGRSVWPAVIGHGAINGIAGIGILFIQGQPNLVIGPAPTGVVGMVPWILLAGWLLSKQGSLTPPNQVSKTSQ